MSDQSNGPKKEWEAPPERRIGQTYLDWLRKHLDGAKVRYEELSRLDDEDQARGADGEYYEQAHQMFGYIAALEKCLREAQSPGAAAPQQASESDPRPIHAIKTRFGPKSPALGHFALALMARCR